MQAEQPHPTYIIESWPKSAQAEFWVLFYAFRLLKLPWDALTQKLLRSIGRDGPETADNMGELAYKFVAHRYQLPDSPSADLR